jgi:CMP-N-acetylneuraminic acid synthetase
VTDQVLAVIPARSGSKRLAQKNIREVGGKPLLAYAIEHARTAEAVDHSIVSTESEEIKTIAREYGGAVPFDRPDHLATDTATGNEVTAHALRWFQDRDRSFDTICLVPVTTPFRTPADITGCIEALHESEADSIVSVAEFDPPPFWATNTDNQYIQPYFTEEWGGNRTQEVPTLHHPNGAVFAARVQAFLESGTFYTDQTISYEMPRSRSLDIDEPFDLELARALTEYRSCN